MAVSRSAALFPRPDLAEMRVLNPDLYARIRPRRPFPLPSDRPDCPAGGAHEQGGSADYTLPFNHPGARGQANWRCCAKCQAAVYGGNGGGICAKGGAHDLGQSGDYVIATDVTAPGYQPDWRWCNKCQVLAYGGAPGQCAAGGAHDHTGSGNYALAMNQPDAEGQSNWRWCSKCQTLSFAGAAAGATREELGLPVATSDPIDEAAPLEAATGGGSLYLPRYRLADRVVSGSEQYDIRLAPDSSGQWSLRVVLEKVRPAGVTDPAAGELPHDLLLRLTYRLTMSDGGATVKTLDFTEVGETEDKSAVVATMHFASPAERDQVLSAITTNGSGCGIVGIRTVRVAVPITGAPGRFRPVTRGLPQTVDPDPLFLNPALHPYLTDAAAPHGGGPGLVLKQLQQGTRFFKYWQDATDPTRIFYLPDAFRLARRDKPAPLTPLMSVRIVPGAAADAEPQVAFQFVATPWTDTSRLDDARRQFAHSLAPAPAHDGKVKAGDVIGGLLGGLLGGGAAADAVGTLTSALGLTSGDEQLARIRMEPLPVGTASFWLALPGQGGGGLVERTAAQVDVTSAIVDSETLAMADFQAVYDAMMGGGSVAVMTGEVRVDFGNGNAERIPFEGRLDRTNGDVMTSEITPGTKAGEFSITLTNAIESPIDVANVNASLLVGSLEVGAAETFTPALPHRLAPGESLAMAVRSKVNLPSPLPPGVTVAPMLDMSKVSVVPEGPAIWSAVLDADTAAQATRAIRVKLFPGMFDAPSHAPEERAFAIIVQFENGPSLELTPEKPEGTAALRTSITDLVLRRANALGYRYKCQIIRRSSRPADADWRSDTTDLLIPNLPAG